MPLDARCPFVGRSPFMKVLLYGKWRFMAGAHLWEVQLNGKCHLIEGAPLWEVLVHVEVPLCGRHLFRRVDQIPRLQYIQNAAMLELGSATMPVLQKLHWQPVGEKIDFNGIASSSFKRTITCNHMFQLEHYTPPITPYLLLHKCNLSMYELRTFSYIVPVLWNQYQTI